MPKVKIHLRTPKGVDTTPPWIFAFPSEFFLNISHRYVFGVKESNGDNEKILSLLHDLENQSQTLFCMTFLISGCKHDTKLILVSILTFSRSWISNMLKKIMWPSRLTLELKVTHIHCMTFLIFGCIQDTDLILVSILTFARSRISGNSKSITWPWWLTLKMKVKHICVWPFVSMVVNIIQTWSLYRFWQFRGLICRKCWNNLRIFNVWPWNSRSYTFFIWPCLSMFDLDFQGQLWRSGDICESYRDSKHRICSNRHQHCVSITYTTHDKQWVTMSNSDLDFQGHPLRSSDKF